MQTITHKNKNILLLSDTHGKHRNLSLGQDIDIVIHCGDICNDGNIDEITDFFDWFYHLDIPNKIFVPGNHDLFFELEPEKAEKIIPKNVIWLKEEINIDGLKIKFLDPFLHYMTKI